MDLSLLCLWPFGNSLTETVHSEFYQCHTQNRSRTLRPRTLQRDSCHRLATPTNSPPRPTPHKLPALSQPKMTFEETVTLGEGLNSGFGEGGERCPNQGVSDLNLKACPQSLHPTQPTLAQDGDGVNPARSSKQLARFSSLCLSRYQQYRSKMLRSPPSFIPQPTLWQKQSPRGKTKLAVPQTPIPNQTRP